MNYDKRVLTRAKRIYKKHGECDLAPMANGDVHLLYHKNGVLREKIVRKKESEGTE